VRAAVSAGYGIEIDLQLSADGAAMVFHDPRLERLTAERGPVRERRAAELSATPLAGGDEGIPTFAEILAIVAGRVPLLVELKDQTGEFGPGDDTLERAAAGAVAGYPGPLAFMSFNPHMVAALAALAPDVPRGLVSRDFVAEAWPGLAPELRRSLASMADLERIEAAFVSRNWRHLGHPRVAEARAGGRDVMCWTIRSAEEAAAALALADQITFEGFEPPLDMAARAS